MRFTKVYEFMKTKEEIQKHLDECREFDNFKTYDMPTNNRFYIECPCGKNWTIPREDLHSYPDFKRFIESANMFSHTIREKAILNTTPIEDVIDPLLGHCLDISYLEDS